MKCLRLLILISSILFSSSGVLHAIEYVAFSLKAAKERIASTPNGKDFRDLHPELFTLCGITSIRGMIYDSETEDVILVGVKDLNRTILTLDDFVVSLRSRFVHGKWPLVSIDPTSDTEKTNMQHVRFEGGIENTKFGKDLLEADYKLKRIGMGLIPSGLADLKSYWDLRGENLKKRLHGSYKIRSRFWFYPVLHSVSVREDVVAMKGLKIGVFTEVLLAEIEGRKIEDLSTFQDRSGDEFAKEISVNFNRLTKIHHSFSRLQGLNELLALTKGIEEMDEKPDLSYWLKDYLVKQIKTKKEVELLKKNEEYKFFSESKAYKGYRMHSGGVHLMAIALRLKAGDVTALREAVLNTRPSHYSLTWSFIVGEWIIPTSAGMLEMVDLAPLFVQAMFLREAKRYDDALILYDNIIHLKPKWSLPYNDRGLTYADKEQYERAISDYLKALKIDPRFCEAYYNLGISYYKTRQYDKAIASYDKAIEIKPQLCEAYLNRGLVFEDKGKYEKALSDYNIAIEINPKFFMAYLNRGNIFDKRGLHEKAISDYDRSIEINPKYAEAYNNRGKVHHYLKEYNKAISDFNKSIDINPQLSEVYSNRGNVYHDIGQYNKAISDHNRAIKINPLDYQAYFNRGNTYESKALYNKAISDYNKAIAIDPQLSRAYINLGIVYDNLGHYEKAVLNYNRAIKINPDDATAYYNRGNTFSKREQLSEAILDYNRAIEINPKLPEAYYNKATCCEKVGRIRDAIEAYKFFIKYASLRYKPYIEQIEKKIEKLEKEIRNK